MYVKPTVCMCVCVCVCPVCMSWPTRPGPINFRANIMYSDWAVFVEDNDNKNIPSMRGHLLIQVQLI